MIYTYLAIAGAFVLLVVGIGWIAYILGRAKEREGVLKGINDAERKAGLVVEKDRIEHPVKPGVLGRVQNHYGSTTTSDTSTKT